MTFIIKLKYMIGQLPGSWKGTSTKFLIGLVLRLRVLSKIREAPSITCLRSSYIEPVTSKTKASVEALSSAPECLFTGETDEESALVVSARMRKLTINLFILA